MPPFKYALVVNDDYMTVPQLSAHFGVHKSVLAKAAKRGELSVAWIEAWKRQRWLFAEAKRVGVSSDLIWHRRRAWGECDRVYLEPPQERFRKLSACRKARAA